MTKKKRLKQNQWRKIAQKITRQALVLTEKAVADITLSEAKYLYRAQGILLQILLHHYKCWTWPNGKLAIVEHALSIRSDLRDIIDMKTDIINTLTHKTNVVKFSDYKKPNTWRI